VFKRKEKSKAELIHEIETKMLVKKARGISKDSLWPLLVEHSQNIEEAKRLCMISVTYLDTLFSELSRTMKLSELIKDDGMKENDKYYPFMVKVIELFKDEDVSFTRTVMQGVSQEIERLQRKEASERKLDTLKTDFIDDI
jgi:hypothetical protein